MAVMKIINSKRILFSAFTIIVVMVACSLERAKVIVLSGYCYAVPSEFIINSGFSADFSGLRVDRSVSQIHLEFSSGYVSQNVPGFLAWVDGSTSRIQDDLTVVVSALSSEDIEYIESGFHFAELWKATGSYSEERLGRRVGWDDELSLYRVYREEISDGWAFVDINPEEIQGGIPNSNHVIALCNDTVRLGRESYTCLHGVVRNGIKIEYSLPSENFYLYNEVDEFIFNTLHGWKIGRAQASQCN